MVDDTSNDNNNNTAVSAAQETAVAPTAVVTVDDTNYDDSNNGSTAVSADDPKCECSYNPWDDKMGGGCRIKTPAPPGKACYCEHDPENKKCDAYVVDCRHPDDDACKTPGTGRCCCVVSTCFF